MRDSNLLIIGFLVVVTGWVLQTTDSISCASATCGNAGTVLQLIATASIIAGLLILAIGFLNFTKSRKTHLFFRHNQTGPELTLQQRRDPTER